MSRTKSILWIAIGAVLLLVLLGLTLVPGVVARSMNRTLDGASGTIRPDAAALHATLLVADLHSDALLWDRDLNERGDWGHTDVPRLLEGRVALQSFTAVTKTPKDMNIEANPGDTDNITMLAVMQLWPRATWSSLTARALHQADKLRATEDASDGRFTIIETSGDLTAYLARRANDDDITAGFLGIEGTHALEGELANVDLLFDAGYRMFGLTHFFDNEVGGSAHGVDKAGLTDLGHAVLTRMEELGILVDLAHASPALIDDVLASATRPVAVSHSGVKGTCDNRRNLDDTRLAAIAATDGVVGIGLWETALCGTTPTDWARDVRHAVDVTGVDHVGLGSDWDGAVAAIVDPSQTVHLTQALMDADFDDESIRKIMGGNVLRLMGAVLPAGGT
jgi:microsomal dipeptidase-like Zn-dependent dipeptidase